MNLESLRFKNLGQPHYKWKSRSNHGKRIFFHMNSIFSNIAMLFYMHKHDHLRIIYLEISSKMNESKYINKMH